jgi:FkbM family methyltransferase
VRLIETCEGPFWAFGASVIGNALATGAFWDGQIKPSIDAAAKARPGSWAIDLGANQGWFTLYMAKIFSGVIALEAHPTIFKVLRKNVERGEDRAYRQGGMVRAYQLAAYNEATTLELAGADVHGWNPPNDFDTDPNGDSLAFVPVRSGQERLTVKAVAVDTLVPKTLDIGFIKVDCQGADLRALVGLTATIKRCRPRIVFEVEHGLLQQFGDTWEDHLDFFKKIGYYEPRRLHDHAWDYEVLPNETE